MPDVVAGHVWRAIRNTAYDPPMPAPSSAIEKALHNAERLRQANSANEANTRALVIEPVLAALGWDPGDLSQVDREYCVYDGTFLDYALKIDGAPRLFLEAKALGTSLGDKKFVSQTVNYANNEGVVWCVLTNGLSYRVYKTNEPVPMDKKLLFATDLGDATNGRMSEVVQALQRIGRTAVEAGKLDEWGERVFTDIRVRTALQGLAIDPPEQLYRLLEGAVEKPVPTRPQLQRSLQRILDVPVAPKASDDRATQQAAAGKGTGTDERRISKPAYDMAYHTAGKPTGVADLFEQVDEAARNLGADVVRKVAKVSVNYFVGKRPFASIKALNSKVVVFLVLDPKTTVPENPEAMRDLTGMGHHGNGDVEYSLTTADQLPEVRDLLSRAHQRAQ